MNPEAVVPTIDSVGVMEYLKQIFTDFHAAWYLGIAAVCYLIIQVLRGKAGFNIPYVTTWIEKLNKEAKTYIILVLFAAAGGLSTLGTDKMDIWVVLTGILDGVTLGITTVGVRNITKQGIEKIAQLKAGNGQ